MLPQYCDEHKQLQCFPTSDKNFRHNCLFNKNIVWMGVIKSTMLNRFCSTYKVNCFKVTFIRRDNICPILNRPIFMFFYKRISFFYSMTAMVFYSFTYTATSQLTFFSLCHSILLCLLHIEIQQLGENNLFYPIS